jgi:hypothetical protein
MPNPRRGESRQNFVHRCMGDSEAQSSFPDNQQRLAFCESRFDRHQANHFFEDSFLETATCAARRVDFWGRSFRVVPAVLVRAQVLRNNLGATFLPAEEITDDWAAQWNNIPVLVGPHPSVEGYASSGRTPELINERGVGWIFNARAENGPDGTRRLVGEVWLDESRAAVVAGFQAVIDRLDAGQPVELSTGFAVQMDEVAGVHNGQSYELTLHPEGADHLVISVEMTGACSVLHGCGLGANEEGDVEDKDKQTKEAGAGNDTPTQSVGGTQHPASDFAYAPSGAPASDWKLPIFDADHVRAALARFNQTQLPSNARAHAWRRVLAAAERLNVTVTDRTMPGHNSKSLWDKVATLLGRRESDTALSWEDHEALRFERGVAQMQLAPSDDERRQMIREALQEAYGASDRDVIVCDVYSDQKVAIFWFSTPMGPMPKGAEYYKVGWTENADGKPVFGGEPTLVRRQTMYEPVAANAADPTPAPAAVVEEPAVNETGSHELVQAVERLKAANERLGALV